MKKAEVAWTAEDKRIRADVYAWRGVTSKTIEDLAKLVGMSKVTMYSRIQKPGTLKLDEYRRLYQVIGPALREVQG